MDVFGSAKACVISITWVPRLVFVFESIKACVMSITWVPFLLGCCALQIETILFLFFLVITQAIHVSLLNKRQYHILLESEKQKKVHQKEEKQKEMWRKKSLVRWSLRVEKGVLGAIEAQQRWRKGLSARAGGGTRMVAA